MHPAPAFRTTDAAVLLERFREHPFCTVAASGEDGPVLTHTPVLAGADGSLRFHVARANRIASALAASGRALVATLGPHAYVSPAWYEAPDQVGTWNYISAEAEGVVEALGAEATLGFLHDLAATFDDELPWTDARMSPRRMEGLLRAIRAYRLVPDRLEGTSKLSQNKSAELREQVAAKLGDHAIAGLMRDTKG